MTENEKDRSDGPADAGISRAWRGSRVAHDIEPVAPEGASAADLDDDGPESAAFQRRRVSDIGEGRRYRLVARDGPSLQALRAGFSCVDDGGFDQSPHPATTTLLAGHEETGEQPGRARVDWLFRRRGQHARVGLAGPELAPRNRLAVGVSDEPGRWALLHLAPEGQPVAFAAALLPFRAALAPVLAPAACARAAAAEEAFDIRPALGREGQDDIHGHCASLRRFPSR